IQYRYSTRARDTNANSTDNDNEFQFDESDDEALNELINDVFGRNEPEVFQEQEEVLDANNVFHYDDMLERGNDERPEVVESESDPEDVAMADAGEVLDVDENLSQRLSQSLSISQQERTRQKCGKGF